VIVSKVYGGIGNQLFMYAFGLSQARRLNTEFKLDIDILLYNPYHYTPYNFELTNFIGVTEQLASNVKGLISVEESKMGTNEIKGNSILDGYWQDEGLFDNIKAELRNKLVFKQKPILNINSNSVSIHARRGDYLNGDYFVDLAKTDYYKKAIEYVLSKAENPTFYIFSNDINWAKEYFSFIKQNKVFLNNNTIEDLYLMSLCKHNITANSTYSWWAAWLNSSPDKIVIQPHKWYETKNIEKLKQRGSVII